jgi:uncharacterized glyoxalase superfamily protein PhnB
MLKNRSMPSNSVIPVLGYPDVRGAVAWLTRAFGFSERLRIADHRAQMSFGDGSIVVVQSEGRCTDPLHSIMVRVTDLDAHFGQAKGQGADIVAEPASFPYGERQYTARDTGGHVWTFSQTIEDVDPASWGGQLS